MSFSKVLRLLLLPAKMTISDPRITGALLLAILYYPEKLQSIIPARAYPVITSSRFIQALEFLLGVNVIRMANNKLSQYVTNNWKSDSKFVKSQEIVLITGGCSGIGFSMAEEFLKLGTKVVVMDLNLPKAPLPTLPTGIHFYQCDVTSASQIQVAARKIREAVGDPTVLINNAGIGGGATILDSSEDFIRKRFEVNTMAHFWMVREFLPAMIKKKHGHVVTIASMASFCVQAGNVDYACSKASALAFHEGLASELKSRHKAPEIRTTVVHPSWIRTAMMEPWLQRPDFKESVMEPEDVASAVVKQVVSGKSGQLFLPHVPMCALAMLRSWPAWIQQSIRNHIARQL